MAHRIIISSTSADGEAHANHSSDASQVEYTFRFAPSHALPEREVDRRAAKIRRTLRQLEAEMSAPLATDA